MADGLDAEFKTRDSTQRMNLNMCTDSGTLYELSIFLSQTTERRFLTDLAQIREAFERNKSPPSTG